MKAYSKAYSTTAALLGLAAAAPACAGPQPSQLTVDSVRYTPDGTLVVATNDGFFLFDEQLVSQQGHIALGGPPAFKEPNLYTYSLSADGTVAAASYSSGTSTTAPILLDLYRVPSGEVLNRFQIAPPGPAGFGNRMLGMALSPHGDRVATMPWGGSNGRLTVMDTVTGAVVWTIPSMDRSLAGWSADGATLYAAAQTSTSSILEAYDAGGALKWSQPFPYIVWPVSVIADGTMLAGVASEVPCASPCVEQYSLWSAADGSQVAQLALPPDVAPYSGPYGGVGNGAFTCSATDNVCAIQLEDRNGPPYPQSLRVYRTDGADVLTLPLGSSPASSVALSPDGQFVAVGTGVPAWAPGRNAVDVYRISDAMLVGSHDFGPPMH